MDSGDFIIPFDPDGNSIPEIIPKLINKINEGYDMVIVSRYKDNAYSADDTLLTAFGNMFFTKVINIFYKANYTDTLGMYRAFKKVLITNLMFDRKKRIIVRNSYINTCYKIKVKCYRNSCF